MSDNPRVDTRIVLDGVFNRTLMWVTREEYFAVVDFLLGYDNCCRSLDLHNGFYVWLVEKLDGQVSGIGWPWVALMLFPGYESPDNSRVFPGREREFIDGLRDLLFEYLDQRGSGAGHGGGCHGSTG